MSKYKLKYRYTTKEDMKHDITWHKCHEFGKGYAWHRYSDNIRVYAYELNSINIKFSDFPKLNLEKIEEIASIFEAKRKKEVEERREYFKNNPIKFDRIIMPKIKK